MQQLFYNSIFLHERERERKRERDAKHRNDCVNGLKRCYDQRIACKKCHQCRAFLVDNKEYDKLNKFPVFLSLSFLRAHIHLTERHKRIARSHAHTNTDYRNDLKMCAFLCVANGTQFELIVQ